MKPTSIGLRVLGLTVLGPSLVAGSQAVNDQVVAELDAYWAEVSRTVAEGDFESYKRLYHPDAVLVDLQSGTSLPIEQAFAGWEPSFVDTREGRAPANVEFRFTQRLHDATTAHETGIFRYTSTPEDADPTVVTFHFEGLLVRQDGAWLMLMEYQKQPATSGEWESADRVRP